jgi:hypothetical protein
MLSRFRATRKRSDLAAASARALDVKQCGIRFDVFGRRREALPQRHPREPPEASALGEVG